MIVSFWKYIKFRVLPISWLLLCIIVVVSFDYCSRCIGSVVNITWEVLRKRCSQDECTGPPFHLKSFPFCWLRGLWLSTHRCSGPNWFCVYASLISNGITTLYIYFDYNQFSIWLIIVGFSPFLDYRCRCIGLVENTSWEALKEMIFTRQIYPAQGLPSVMR